MTSQPAAEVVLAAISAEPLSVDAVLAAVRDPRAGAAVVFVGVVRDHDHGRGVTVLEYSAHPAAQDAATALAAELAQRGEAVRIAVVHRVGTLAVGDLAVVAAVSAEHRAEAFAVCRELIDRFKAQVPVWKHQHFTDGGDEWVGVT
ncbi:MAG: molybdenum cofactor biosynthesis protein MoaE [Dermatophilaceae bacterium]